MDSNNSLKKWFVYIVLFFIIISIGWKISLKTFSAAMVLGFFAGVLNEILDKIGKK